ncbi:MAG: NADPH:quinone reductase [Rhodoglobus sp.]|nr:NADPH:quinone reductase [Rhodoglobus sp.]
MRAIVQDAYGEADVLRVGEADIPTVGDGDVLVRVRAAGVDQGVWHLMAGVPYLIRLGTGRKAPKNRIRGLDVAGTVEAVGAGVTAFRPGDEVYGCANGSFAEFTVARVENLALKPKTLTFEQAAAVPVSACAALHAVRDAGGVREAQQVLVIGAAGGVGSFAVQIARALGATVTGVCSSAKVEFVRGLGVETVIDYEREGLPENTFDVIIDTGGNRPVAVLRRALKRGGTLVLAGAEVDGKVFAGMGRMVRAAMLSSFVSQKLTVLMSSESTDDLEYLATLIDEGKVSPAVDRTYPLEGVPDAIRDLRAGRVRGKIVIAVARA